MLLDLSRSAAEDLDFPVLFPGLDIPNHCLAARVDYLFEPGRFDIATQDAVRKGEEVFNNYGQKNNAELLIGYGFCIVDNPNDTVGMMLKVPPPDLQTTLQTVHAGFFDNTGAWKSEQATFQLSAPHTASHAPVNIWSHLPEPLLQLLLYIHRHERGLSFELIPKPVQYLTDPNEDGTAHLPHIAKMVMQSLVGTHP